MEKEIKYPVRVLHVLHSMNRGGAENALMNYYREIEREKIQFDFLLTDPNKCDFEDEILSLGGKVFRVPRLTIKSPMPYINGVRCFLKSHPEYQIVHSHTSSKSVVPLGIAKLCGVPVRISHSHNSMSESGINGRIREALKPLLQRTANVYFSCGKKASEWLYGKNLSHRGKVRIIRNVIHASKFRYSLDVRNIFRKKLDIEDNTLVIGQVARFCREKNHKFSLEILYHLLKKRKNVYLLLLGDGPERESIEAYAKELGISEHIKMVGVAPNVYDYEQVMDVFILPSFYEGLPLSIIEAQVSGLPCFTTEGSVSKECSVTDLVSYLPLEDGAERWANEILKYSSIERRDRFEEIKAAGYDSVTSARKLQDMYIHLAKFSKLD